jgi:hypothetical protein
MEETNFFFFFFFDLTIAIYTTHTHTLFGEGRGDSNLCHGGEFSLAPLGQMPSGRGNKLRKRFRSSNLILNISRKKETMFAHILAKHDQNVIKYANIYIIFFNHLLK